MPRRVSTLPRLSRRTLGALLLALPVALCTHVAHAQAQALTLAQYDQKLAAVQAATDAYAVRPPASVPSPKRMPSVMPIETALAPITRCAVLTPGRDASPATLLLVDNRPTLTTLKRIERETDPARRNALLAALRNQLTLLRAQTQASIGAAPQGPRGAAAARAVLSAPEFASDPVPPPSYLERQTDKMLPWLDAQWRKFERLFHLSPSPLPDMKIDPRVPLGILILIVIVAGGLLIAFLARLITGANWARFRQARSSAAETGLALTEEEAALVAARDFDQLLALARQRADSGDYRSAFRLVYLASLVTLDQQGLVRLNKSRTNWEYLRAVRQTGNDGLYDALLPMTRGFDRIWYGLRPATRTDYEQALSGHASLRGQAGIS